MKLGYLFFLRLHFVFDFQNGTLFVWHSFLISPEFIRSDALIPFAQLFQKWNGLYSDKRFIRDTSTLRLLQTRYAKNLNIWKQHQLRSRSVALVYFRLDVYES